MEHRIEIPNPAAGAFLMRWESPAGMDLPKQQTLERLICTALRQHHPDRLSQVDAWLQPEMTTSGKSFAWSYMAKWQPQDGCDRFFEALWLDKPVAETLLRLLEATPCNSAVMRQLRPEPV
ncbi:hypothetical protein IV102_35760 [bacterium]|nr:hypothetical protein [bacterium]